MKSVLIIGLGQYGRSMVEKLNELGHEVMAVDKEEQKVNEALPLVTDAQIGDASNEVFLESLGVANYDVCFVTITSDFQSSLVATSLLKDLGARRVVSLASGELHKKFLLRNGADHVVYPARHMADWAVIRYVADHVLDYIALDSEYAIYDISVPEEWDGKSVGSLDIRKKYGLNILAVRGNGVPSTAVTSDTIMRAGRTILVLGRWKDIQKCFRT